MNTYPYDVIIVGTGAAGLFAALHLPSDNKVVMLTKDDLENSDSYLAQGGICTLLNPDEFCPRPSVHPEPDETPFCLLPAPAAQPPSP